MMIGLGLSLVIGCGTSGPETYPVQGVVRFSDGQVLRGGSIEFEGTYEDRPILATGQIGPDGSFQLGTRQLDDGAVSGSHRVVVISDFPIGNGAERPELIPPSQLHSRYRSFRTSGLVQEVLPKSNALVIEVEYAKAAETPADSDLPSDDGE